MRVAIVSASVVGLCGLAGLAGCANDPLYIPGPMAMEAGNPDMMGAPTEAKASVELPIKTETASDKTKRDALQAKLAPVMVPYVKIGDIEIEVEWTITNLDSKPGKATVELNGANEFFAYDPSTIVLEPGNDEAPPTPGLGGDIPIDVPAGAEVSGLLTEDDVRE